MHLEITICTHNRSILLDKTLSSLATARAPVSATLTVVIVANACTDETVDLINKLQPKFPYAIQTIIEEKPGKSHALNKAIDCSTAHYLVFIDDDHRVDDNFIQSIEKAINDNPEYNIICGKIIPDWTGNEPEWIHNKEYPIYPLPIPHYDLGNDKKEVTVNDRLPGGGNITVNKSTLTKIGHFNTNLGPQGHNLGGGEDGDYIKRALEDGNRILYNPLTIQYHWVDISRLRLRYLLNKAYLRSLSATAISIPQPEKPPRFLYRKLLSNLLYLLVPLPINRFKFYLMRTCSTLGEISAYKKSQSLHSHHNSRDQ